MSRLEKRITDNEGDLEAQPGAVRDHPPPPNIVKADWIEQRRK
jgi:hypothetical protein